MLEHGIPERQPGAHSTHRFLFPDWWADVHRPLKACSVCERPLRGERRRWLGEVAVCHLCEVAHSPEPHELLYGWLGMGADTRRQLVAQRYGLDPWSGPPPRPAVIRIESTTLSDAGVSVETWIAPRGPMLPMFWSERRLRPHEFPDGHPGNI
jgi:hypothetical protein